MRIAIHPHARQRMSERGVTAAQVRQTVLLGSAKAAKFGRTQFRHLFTFNAKWHGKHYAHRQIDAFAAKIPDGWLVVTVIVKYF